MSPEEFDNRLSRLQTAWSLVFQAHQGPQGPAGAARRQLLLRYRGAVYRYLLGALRDADAADEVAQEFAVRFLEGSFRRADPGRGRFRDLVKTALRHLLIDHWRRQNRAPLQADSVAQQQIPAPPGGEEEADEAFRLQWREGLLAHAWEALAQAEADSGLPYHTLLHWKTEAPQVRSAELAARLGARLGKSFTDNAARKLLHKARALFAELLVEEVARSLSTSDPDELERELIDLQLLDYCGSALRRK
jgi:RNA polymerase sigma-70 factor (ECF subfamily)